jgi:ELWxxDGT repeat protein
MARLERGATIDPEVLADWNGALLFLVGSQHGCAFWSSDGSASGTRELLSMPPGVRCPTAVHPFGSGFLFVARVERRGGPVPQLFLSDGTPAGTRQLSEVRSTREPLYFAPFAQVRGAAYFLVSGLQYQSAELWVTDGTAPGTRRVGADLVSPTHLFAFRGSLYLFATLDAQSSTQRGLFRWEPSADRPLLLQPVDPGSQSFFAFPPEDPEYTPAGDLLFFIGRDERGTALWRTDGTAGGTRALQGTADGDPADASGIRAAGGRVFFTAHEEIHGYEPWESDGRPAGTRRVADIRPGFLSSRAGYLPSGLAVAAGHLLFAADDGVTGMEPWALELLP